MAGGRRDVDRRRAADLSPSQVMAMNIQSTLTFFLLLGAVASGSAQVPDTARLGDLVVTATRQAAPQGAIPAATTVIRGDDLRARGVTLVLDALREVPGFAVVQAGSFGAQTSIFLRGGESNYVK